MYVHVYAAKVKQSTAIFIKSNNKDDPLLQF